MQVRRIEAIPIRYPEPNDFGHERMTVLVRAETTDGATGWGEAIAMWPEACAAVCCLIDGLAALVIGRDPADVVALWDAMKRHSWWYGEGGLASMAIAGVDMALWDLKAGQAGQPLSALLGGTCVDRLPALASIHVNQGGIEALVRDVAAHIAAGFRAVKFGFGKRGDFGVVDNPFRIVEAIAAVRAAVGPSVDLMVDIGNGLRLDAATAIRLTRELEEYRIAWIEEPLHPADIAGYRTLRAATMTPIASGEREWTVEGYRRLLATDTVDVFGIDPARAEGITGFRQVLDLVGAARRHVNAHAWSTAITTAASLHLSVISPWTRVFELKPLPTPVQTELVDAPIWHDGAGWCRPPQGPGLGISVNESVVERYRARL